MILKAIKKIKENLLQLLSTIKKKKIYIALEIMRRVITLAIAIIMGGKELIQRKLRAMTIQVSYRA